MNRIYLAVLFTTILAIPAVSQEPDSVPVFLKPDSVAVFQEPDSVAVFQEPDSVPVILKPDSVAVFQEPDSVPVFQKPDSVKEFQISDTLDPFKRVDSASVIQDRYQRMVENQKRLDSVNNVDSIMVVDSLEIVQPDFSHSTSKAIMYALVLPGLGQAYNKKYFKMPLVWAAVGAVGYSIVYTTKEYQKSSREYSLNPDDLNERIIRYWRRNVELSYIGLIVVYALQVVDAYVDAQLYNWDVSENLSLRVAPSLQRLMSPTSLTGQSYGFTFSLNLKGK